MASIKFSFTFILLVSGLVMLGTFQSSEAACNLFCVRGTYITCSNRPNEQLYGCACRCAPPDGQGCVVHLADGSTQNC